MPTRTHVIIPGSLGNDRGHFVYPLAVQCLVYSLCHECDGTGWITYSWETLDGKLAEAYRLCPSCCSPRRCMGFEADYPCLRPGTMRYGLCYDCKEHIEVIRVGGGLDHVQEAIYYLRRMLQMAHDRGNKFLKMHLSKALPKLRRGSVEPSESYIKLAKTRGI